MSDEAVMLYLLRHGEPVKAGLMLGRTDIPATSAGIAACVAQATDLELDAVVSSGFLRTSACAAPIAVLRGIQMVEDVRWRELDFGAWDGLAAADIDPVALGRFWDDPDRDPPPNGERWSALVSRVAEAVGTMPSNALVVTHAGAMRAALSSLCGLDFKQVWAFDLPYAALLSIRVWRGTPSTTRVSGQITGLLP